MAKLLKRWFLATLFTTLLAQGIHSQTKKLQIVDPLLFSHDSLISGIPSYVITEKNGIRDTLQTDSNGYVEIPTDTTVKVPVKKGWNIVSTPLKTEDKSKNNIFPGSISEAYKYNEGYLSSDSLERGIGYWLKFSNDDSISVEGKYFGNDTVLVRPGWNLVGNLDKEMNVENIQVSPSDLIISSFYKFDRGYEPTSSLKVGEGYWINANKDGELIFGNTPGLEAKIENNSLPPSPPQDEVKSEVRVNLNKENVKVYDVLGREVDIKNKLNNGVYFFRVFENDKMINSGKLINLDNSIFFGNKISKENTNVRNFSKKTSLDDSIRIFVKDELTDSVGDYHDFEEIYLESEIPNKIALFPSAKLLDFHHVPDSRFDTSSALAFDRFITFSDNVYWLDFGNYILNHYPKDMPLKIFANRDSMPNLNYSMAFDSAMSNWKNLTSFLYKGVLLPAEDLVTEVTSKPDTGVYMRYYGTTTGVNRDLRYPQPFEMSPPNRGPPILTKVNMNTNYNDFEFIKEIIQHEFWHVFFDPSNSSREDDAGGFNPMNRDYNGKIKRLNNSLQKFFPIKTTEGEIQYLVKVGVYKED